jgi:hypothetical protein
MSRRRICFTVDLGDGATVRIQTNGTPPSEADMAALREVRDCLVARLGNPNQWPVDGDGREVHK